MLPSWFVPMLGICLVFAILMNSWIPLLTKLIRDFKSYAEYIDKILKRPNVILSFEKGERTV